MAQQTGRQYDDDLTVGADEYSESFSTDYVDLFEPLGDDDAPIAKLKTIILSIDWEITDDILHQLNDELQDLKDVWAGSKINLVYIQALEKLGRYIFAEKANAHPNAIKLLLTFYYDLEKIVSSVSMSEGEKKQLLLQDVKKFEQFKLQIAPGSKEERRSVAPVAVQEQVVAPAVEDSSSVSQGQKSVLTNLKAIVLSIDWEISESELVRLNEEVNKLEKIFSESRAKLIFLQGIGALGNYIRTAKSNAHLDAFKLLHSFYEGLERVYNEVLSKEQEKKILLAEVKKFNDFKAVIATVASEVVVPVDESASRPVEEEEEEEGGVFAPAFADMPDDVRGFREDTEAVKDEIDKGVASFLGGEEVVAGQFAGVVGATTEMAPEAPEVSSRLEALFGENEEFEAIAETADAALQGVDVETEADDDSDEKALPLLGGRLAPALAEAGGQNLYAEKEPVAKAPLTETVVAPFVQGVDVETEADDESEEAELPRHLGGVSPALVFADEEKGFREPELVGDSDEEEFDLEDRLHAFFGAEIEEASLGSGLRVGDDASEELSATEASTDELGVAGVATSNEIRPASSPEDVEEGIPAAFSELLDLEGGEDAEKEELLSPAPDFGVAQEALEMAEPEGSELAREESLLSFLESEFVEEQNVPVADMSEVEPIGVSFDFEEVGTGLPGEIAGESPDVIFEPVGDDVEVDELPVMGGSVVSDEVIAWEREAVARIRECVTVMLAKQDETAYPGLIIEINKLGQRCQTQFAKKMLLQLMGVVGQYLDIHRIEAGAESLTLLQSLCDKLEQVCRQNTGFSSGQEEMLFEESGKVLIWQQGLISALSAKERDESSEVVDDLADLFSEEE